MNYEQIMEQLQQLGSEQTKKTLINHGAKEPLFGVKVGDMKKLVKFVKKDQELALQLFASGNYDAMYLAGLSINPMLMSKQQLQEWVQQITWHAPAEYTVAWIAAESDYAVELAREWIQSPDELIAVCGWSTYASYVTITPDDKLDMKEIEELLQHIGKVIHTERNWVKYVMNGFVIAIGSYVPILSGQAKEVAEQIGSVQVNVGNTACKVPFATDYITKVEQKGKLGVKRKTCIC